MSTIITTTSLLAEATSVLESAGFDRDTSSEFIWPVSTSRVFEDSYSVVSLLVFETWDELRDKWTEAQAQLVEIISGNIGRNEPKAWDGYLVLMTSESAGSELPIANQIRYDISRVRKLIATAEDIRDLVDVRRVLLPLLPLEPSLAVRATDSVMDQIPNLLANRGIPSAVGTALVDAYQNQEPLLEKMHQARKTS